MEERNSQAEMIITINNEEGLNELSKVELDLLLTESQCIDENLSKDTQQETESSISAPTQSVPAKQEQTEEINNNKSLKKASVEVHFIGVHVIPRS